MFDPILRGMGCSFFNATALGPVDTVNMKAETTRARSRVSSFRLMFGAAVLGLVACGGQTQVAMGAQAPSGSDGERVYVASQMAATVSVIDVESGEVLHVVDLRDFGFDDNSRPHDTAADPDGEHWYVSLIGGGHVLRFDSEGELVGRAPFETPGMLAVDPNDGNLYVGRSMMAVSPPQRVGMIDRATMDIEELDVFFPRPHALIADGPNGRVFTASLAENRIAVLDPRTEDVDLVDVAGPPHTFVQFAQSPDGSVLVGTAQLTGKLLVFDASGDGLEFVRDLDVGAQPWHPTYSPDGSRVYFGLKDENAVAVVDTETWTIIKKITAPGISEPHGSAITSDGRYLFVSNRNQKGAYSSGEGGGEHNMADHNMGEQGMSGHAMAHDRTVGTVVKIDTETLEVVQTIEVGAYAAGISIGG